MLHILGTIIIGFVAGVIAKLVAPGDNEPKGFILTTILGIVGAFVATYLGQAIGWYGPDQNAGFIGAIVGAVIILTTTTPHCCIALSMLSRYGRPCGKRAQLKCEHMAMWWPEVAPAKIDSGVNGSGPKLKKRIPPSPSANARVSRNRHAHRRHQCLLSAKSGHRARWCLRRAARRSRRSSCQLSLPSQNTRLFDVSKIPVGLVQLVDDIDGRGVEHDRSRTYS
jgi:uncharacterized membrane protein YeaQ/YmgE (transglycosylase-associated protein family)